MQRLDISVPNQSLGALVTDYWIRNTTLDSTLERVIKSNVLSIPIYTHLRRPLHPRFVCMVISLSLPQQTACAPLDL